MLINHSLYINYIETSNHLCSSHIFRQLPSTDDPTCSSIRALKILMLFCILRTRQNLGLVWSFLSFLLPPSPIILNGLDVFYGCTKRPFHLCKVCALVLAQTRKLTETELLFLEKTAVYHLLPHLPLRSLPFQSIALKEFDRNQFCVSRKWSTCFFQRKLLFILFFFFPV